MARSITSRIRATAIEILKDHPGGVRYAELQRLIHKKDESFNLNTIAGSIFNLDTVSKKVEKPSRGLYRIAEGQLTANSGDDASIQTPKEDSFYEPFADWLKNDLEDVTKAIALGGNKFKDKWGTPDVIGKRDSKPSDIIKPPIEIVSAEIKTNANQLITAFGQACAYCLFSHRSYLVVPRQAAPEEVSRLDSLCQVFGIGFVLFDATNPEDPKFEPRTRPSKQEPDPYYMNKYMKEVELELFR